MTLQQTLEHHGYEVEAERVTGDKARTTCRARPKGQGAWLPGGDALYALYRTMGMPVNKPVIEYSEDGSVGEVEEEEE